LTFATGTLSAVSWGRCAKPYRPGARAARPGCQRATRSRCRAPPAIPAGGTRHPAWPRSGGDLHEVEAGDRPGVALQHHLVGGGDPAPAALEPLGLVPDAERPEAQRVRLGVEGVDVGLLPL